MSGKDARTTQVADLPADRIFWMTELMEAWFLADREALRRYYKDGFQDSALPQNPDVEKIPKKDVEAGLKDATRQTSKGKYHKTKHAPAILEQIDPELVKKSAPQCERLFIALGKLLNSDGN